MQRSDYAFPFQIDNASRQAQRTDYSDHVRQMIRQVLLTAPGERIDLPDFGCGLRQLVFAPRDEALDSATQLIVSRALERWLSDQIRVTSVTLPTSTDDSNLQVQIDYVLLAPQRSDSTIVEIA